MKSWNTTLLGLFSAAILISNQMIALLDNDPTTVFELSAVLAALGLGGVGIAARDNGKRSEDVMK